MKKSSLIKTLFVFSLIFLVLQLFLPKFIEKQHPLDKVLQHFWGIRLILLDRHLLEKLAHSATPVQGLLHSSSSLTFAYLSEGNIPGLTKVRKTAQNLRKDGFYFVEVSSVIGANSSTSHMFLQHDDLLIHIVVLYPQTLSTIATFPASQKDLPNFLNVNKLNYMKEALIFNRFQVEPLGKISVPQNINKFLSDLKQATYIPCDHTRANTFLSRYPQDTSEEAKHFKRKARQIIARAKQYLDGLGIPFWLSSGTCLGWYRQCDIITYSKDVDLGIFIHHYKPELVSTFERGGFFLKNRFGKVSDSFELSFQAGDIKLDLFFFYNETDHIWNGGTEYISGKKLKYVFPPFTLCWTVFLDLLVKVPFPPGPYIEANYGKNWMVPVTNWEWDKSPPNVQDNGFWSKDEMDEVVQVY